MWAGSIPEPTEVLTGRRSLRNTILPPPRSRSPIKTAVNGTPRRTPGLHSSPAKQAGEETPTRGSSRLGAARTLLFTNDQPHFSVENSPLREVRANISPPRINGNRNKGKEPDYERENSQPAPDFSDDEESHLVNGGEPDGDQIMMTNGDHDEGYSGGGADGSFHDMELPYSDIGSPRPADLFEESAEEQPQPVVQSKGGRKRKSDTMEVEASESAPVQAKVRNDKGTSELSQPGKSAPAAKDGKAKKPKAAAEDSDTSGLSIAATKHRGKPPRNAQTEIYRDPDVDVEDLRPAKKAKRVPKARDANAKMSNTQDQELDEVVKKMVSRGGPHNKARSLYILRRETPSDDSVLHTRSGRVSVRPLAYWKNERCVYGDGDIEAGQRFPLSTIKEIIRTEEVEQPASRLRAGKRKGKKLTRRRAREESDEDEDEDDAEPWESERGIFHGMVRKWDQVFQESLDDAEEIGMLFDIITTWRWEKLI